MRGPEIAEDHPPDLDRVVTIPNAISLARLLAIPVFLWLLLSERRVEAAIALALIAWTDWIDGGLARRWHQVTTVGKILDPTVDRFLLLAGMIGAMVDGAVPVWLGLLLLLREVVVGLGGMYLGLKGHRRNVVTWAGKVYAFGIMTALPLFILGNADQALSTWAEVLAWVLVVPSAVLSYMTAMQYAGKARSLLTDGR